LSNGFPGCGKLIAFILIAWISHEKEEGDEICFTQLTEFDTLLLNYLVLHYMLYLCIFRLISLISLTRSTVYNSVNLITWLLKLIVN
jgi:hypothetical protein